MTAGPRILNIFACDPFSPPSDVDPPSNADDNVPHTAKNNMKNVIKSLENNSAELFEWLSDNQMKANPDKWPL